jgi:hypothetical protein
MESGELDEGPDKRRPSSRDKEATPVKPALNLDYGSSGPGLWHTVSRSALSGLKTSIRKGGIMKRKGLLVLLALLALALAAAPALAGSLSASNTVIFTLTFTGDNIDGGTVYSYASYAQGFPITYNEATSTLPGPAVASLTAPPIFPQTQATTSSDQFTVSLMANGPITNTITQQTTNYLSYLFAPDGGGTYSATLSGTYNPAFSLTGNEVVDYTSFNSFVWSSILSASLTTDNVTGTATGGDYQSLETAGYAQSTNGSLPDYLLNTSISNPNPIPFSFNLGSLTVGDGDTVFLDFLLTSSLEGTTSQVPVPPSLVLLGTGLAGMVLTRWRYFRG